MKLLFLFTLFLEIHCFAPTYLARFGVEVFRALIPDWKYDGDGFGIPHVEMTKQGIEYIYPIHFPLVTFPTSPMIKARKEIQQSNGIVDDSGDSEKNLAEAHFDGERLQEGQTRILALRAEVISNLKQGKVSVAREKLGRLLHTLQDFYSHTNWVEQGNTDISQRIGFPGGDFFPRNTVTATCRNCVSFFSSPAEQVAYNENNMCLKTCKKGDNNPLIYGISAACVVLNWRPGVCAPKDCKDNLLGTFSSYVTSGYYGGSHDKGSTVEIQRPNSNKCTHGGVGDAFAYGLEGINKDTLNPVFSPHWRQHPDAAKLAISHTKQFLAALGDQKATTPELTASELRLLYGVGSTGLIFVVDTTGSMDTVISSVRTSITDLVLGVQGTIREPVSYTLVPFNDPPDSTPAFQTSSANEFTLKLSFLSASGGDDCPEPGLHGILKAIQAAPEGGAVFFFTDAGPKDAPDWVSQTVDLALQKNVAVFSFIFPSGCSPDNMYGQGIYERLSRRTGGQPFHISPSNAGQLVKYVAETFLDPFETLIWASEYGTPPPLGPPVRKRQVFPGVNHDIEIESALNNVTFSFSGQGTLHISDPSGVTLTDTMPGITGIKFENVTIFTVSKPLKGTWKVSIDVIATGDTLKVFGSGSLYFSSFDFSEERGDEHPGLFPINRDLVPNEELTVVGSVDRGNFTKAAFEFRTKDGINVIKNVEIPRGSGLEYSIPDNTFIGDTTIPQGEFLVHIVGETDTGEKFRRVIPKTFGLALNGTLNSTISLSSTSTSKLSSYATSTYSHEPQTNSNMPYTNSFQEPPYSHDGSAPTKVKTFTRVTETSTSLSVATPCDVASTQVISNRNSSTWMAPDLSTEYLTSTTYQLSGTTTTIAGFPAEASASGSNGSYVGYMGPQATGAASRLSQKSLGALICAFVFAILFW